MSSDEGGHLARQLTWARRVEREADWQGAVCIHQTTGSGTHRVAGPTVAPGLFSSKVGHERRCGCNAMFNNGDADMKKFPNDEWKSLLQPTALMDVKRETKLQTPTHQRLATVDNESSYAI